MSTIKEILRLQAEAVQKNQDKIKQAEALETAAKFLREQAVKPVYIPLKAMRQAKDERIDKFAAAMRKTKIEEIDNMLTRAGWLNSMRNDDNFTSTWGKKDKPGMLLTVASGKFKVTFHGEVMQAPESLKFIGKFLEQKNK